MMSLIDVTIGYMDHILSAMGSGMKSLLMDIDSMSLVSVSCPQSKLMAKGVYLFEKLDERIPTKRPLTFVSCLCILAPNPKNLDLLKHELQNPRFGQYHVYFTQHLDRSLMKELAESDPHESVKAICEMPLDFCALDSHVFTLKPSRTKEIEGLWSLLKSNNLDPIICYMKSSSHSRNLAEMMSEKMRISASDDSRPGRKSILLIYDRRLDPVTPLLTPWTYQAMIHEFFGIKNNVVELKGCDVPKELEKMVLSTQVDEFFKLNLYKNFGEIGETIRKLISDFQDKKKSHQNCESISDIKNFISNYPEFKKMSGTVNRHVQLVSEISNFVADNNLLQVSEFEQNVCSDQLGSSDESTFKNLIMASNVRAIDKKKLLCIYSLHKGSTNYRQLQYYIDLVSKETGTEKVSLENSLKNASAYGLNRTNEQPNSFHTSSAAATKKFFKGLRGIENVYTQHQPNIQALLEDMLRKKTCSDVAYPADFIFCQDIVIYFLDGFTYEETKVVRDINLQFGSNIIIGGSRLWNSQDFLSHIYSKNS